MLMTYYDRFSVYSAFLGHDLYYLVPCVYGTEEVRSVYATRLTVVMALVVIATAALDAAIIWSVMK